MIKNVYFLYNYSISCCGIDPEDQKCKHETKTIWRLKRFQTNSSYDSEIYESCDSVHPKLTHESQFSDSGHQA